MTALLPSSRLTYEDYLLLPEDGKRHEIIDGEHWMSPSPREAHQRVFINLSWLIRGFLETAPLGVVTAALDVILSDEDIVQPDLLFVADQRRKIIKKHGVVGAPNLMVEILSDSTRQRDLSLKRKTYGRFGVEEYWVVDPGLERVEVYRLGAESAYDEPCLLSGSSATLETPLLPGLVLPLAKIFS